MDNHKTDIHNWSIDLAISTCLVCVMYLPNIVMYLANPDTVVNSIIYKASFGWDVSLGRYFLHFLSRIIGFSVSPAKFTVLGLLLGCICGLLIADLLEIEKRVYRIITVLIFMLSVSTHGGVTYYNWFLFYSIAMLLAVLSLVIMSQIINIKSIRISLLLLIVAALLLNFSLATYQAYLGVFLPVCVIMLVKDLVKEEKLSLIVKKYIYIISGLILGVITYLLSNRFVQSIMGIEANNGRGFDKIGQISENVFKSLYECYRYFLSFYFGNSFLNNDYGYLIKRYIVNIVFYIVLFTIIVSLLIIHRLTIKRLLLIFVIALLFPVTVFSIHIFAPQVSVFAETGSIMLPGLSIVYIILMWALNTLGGGGKSKKS